VKVLNNKIFSFLFCLLSLESQAEIMMLKTDQISVKKIEIKKLESFHVNDDCIKEKKKCLALLNIPKKNILLKGNFNLAGNPASLFCREQSGKSEILYDSKNNEYDYCVLNNKYFVDSWDFYNKNQK
jgi:hypothetical protein